MISSRFSPISVFFGGVTIVNIQMSGVPGRLINFPISEGIQGLDSSWFKDKKFNPGVVLEILKVFHEEVPLSGILLSTGYLNSSRV